MRYRETQLFDWWVWALFALLGLGVPVLSRISPVDGQSFYSASILGVIVLCVALLFGQMTTEVNATDLRICFGWVKLVKFRFSLGEIVTANAETYRPVMEFGGWGIRYKGSNRALNMRGNHGVRLTFANGKRLMVGSCRAQELAEALAGESR